jgi:iron complex outermembrane receptor protein
MGGRTRAVRKTLLASAAMLGLAPATGWAQEARGDNTTANTGMVLEEVIVTAQRREERLQDVPVSVTAYTGAQLEKRNIEDSQDLTKITPGLSFAQTGYTPQPTIRGVGTRGVSAGEESTVSLYIDGIYQPYMTNGFFKLNSVQRIEVLKGPQSTLYGRNSTGGAINVITVDPPVGWKAKLSLSSGSFNETTGKLYLGGGTETLAADFSGVYWKADGYLHDIVSNSDRGDQSDYTVRSKIQWRPTENIKLTLSGSHAQSKDLTANLGRPVNGNTIAARWTPTPELPTGTYDIAFGHDISFKTITNNVALTGTVGLGPVDLNFVSSYMETETKLFGNDPSATAAPVFRSYTSADPSSYYNEVYFRSKGDHRFDWIVGAVYFTDEAPYTDYRIYTWNGVSGAGSKFTFTHHRNSVGTNSKAVYAQGTFDFTDRLSLTLGGRYTDEEKWMNRKGYTSGTVAGILADYSQPDLPYLAPPTVFPDNKETAHFTNFSPSANLQYKVSDNINVYAKAGSGFKSGIFSAGSSSQKAVDPEKITQYEIGIKSDPLPWLRVNAAAYYSDYTGLQAVSRDPVTLAPVLQNAASATIKGVELEVAARPIDRLNLNAGIALSRGKYEKWPGAQVTYPATTVNPPASEPCLMGTGTLLGGNRSVFCDLSGYKIQRQPETMAFVSGDYSWPAFAGGEMMVSTTVSYQSDFSWEPSGRLVEPSRTLVDGELAWTSADEVLRLSLWGQNLTDEAYGQALSASGTSDLITMARPRTVGVRIGFNFQ